MLQSGEEIGLKFRIAGHSKGDLIGYGVWFSHSAGVVCTLEGGNDKRTLTQYGVSSWNRAGSIWWAQDATPVEVTLTLTATAEGAIAFYAPICGTIRHDYLNDARPELMANMYQFVPEALFIKPEGLGEITIQAGADKPTAHRTIVLKSCNRCGRYLPVNVSVERHQLSFSNHCVAEHRVPCKHATFGRLRNVDDAKDIIQLKYGYQLECRFCKKFEVNAAHNPQRTSAQMKEDGARRRAFELLLAELYGGTPQLRYRHENGTELANDVWVRFGRVCYKCGTRLTSPREMHLDHTRPLALLWPLDRTATALCGNCNGEKRDRAPSDFYSQDELVALAELTGIPLANLREGTPNEEALDLLVSRQQWFFEEFLSRDEMTKERDGKVAGELVVKALQKVLARSEKYEGVDLRAEYERRRAKRR